MTQYELFGGSTEVGGAEIPTVSDALGSVPLTYLFGGGEGGMGLVSRITIPGIGCVLVEVRPTRLLGTC